MALFLLAFPNFPKPTHLTHEHQQPPVEYTGATPWIRWLLPYCQPLAVVKVEEVALQFLEPKWGEGVLLFLVEEKACCGWRFRMQELLVFLFLGGGRG